MKLKLEVEFGEESGYLQGLIDASVKAYEMLLTVTDASNKSEVTSILGGIAAGKAFSKQIDQKIAEVVDFV